MRRTGTIVGTMWMSLVVALAGWLGWGAVLAWTAPKALTAGAEPPAMVVTQLDGQPFRLADASNVVLIDFWRPGCVGCIGQTPILNRIHDRYEGQLEIIAVTNAKAEAVERFVDERAVRYPVALDRDDWTRRFGVVAFPTLILLDADGRIAAVHKRGASEGQLIAQLDALVGGASTPEHRRKLR